MYLFIAHIRQTDFKEQSVQQHLAEVAQLARIYGDDVKLGALSELAGFLHDMGKFTIHFTTYLQKAVLENQIATKKIDHSTAGAKYLYECFYGKSTIQNLVVETVGMAVLSHHSGMQNFVQPDLSVSDFIRRVTNDSLPYYEEVVSQFEQLPGNKERVQSLVEEANKEMENFLRLVKPLGEFPTYLTLMQKLVFSCLIDADRTNTRRFEEKDTSPIGDTSQVFKQGYESFMETIRNFGESTKPINQLRSEMSEESERYADKTSAIYTLSIPTGGGKTYASLRYALKHAIGFNKSRIIYIVPYTTILEQNAQAVRDIIGQEHAHNVLEHHGNVVDDAELDSEPDYYGHTFHKKLQLGRDNFDYPIIFTTMVQFLDTFYQKGTRKGRRLHNLTNAVLIFDEVQTVPFKHQSLFNAAVNFLHVVGNSSVVLCTATQPALDQVKPEILLSEEAEMVPNLDNVVKSFERVSITSLVEPEGWDAEEISTFTKELLTSHDSVLIILNTKTAVRNVYKYFENYTDAFVVHLSTSMCPAHRKEKLDEIREKLGKERVICVSTQLIEAGVDISFEVVIRSLAGLDSIAQAAGRCNRNAERDRGEVFIIRAGEENLSKVPEIRIGGEVTENYILSNPEFEGQLLGPKAIETYFIHFFNQANREIPIAPKGLDHPLYDALSGKVAAKQQQQTLSTGMLKTIEQLFEAIESPTKAVIVPYKEGKEIIANLNEDKYDYQSFNENMKKAQQYSVNLYDYEFQLLNKGKSIMPLFDGSIFCLVENAYDESFGVSLDGFAALDSYNF